MKQILLEYLSQLKEREELDAILPDLLSELGYHVYSRPQRGTTQHGVDIAAVGKDPDDGVRKVYLFSVKRGDLTRQEWDQGDQALRPSLNQIRDAYIPTKIPSKYAALPIVVCLVFGGTVRENIQLEVRGYTKSNTTPKVSYEEWNGDKLAELLMDGVLREKVLPAELQTSFRKAIALVDEPDVAYRHFGDLARQVRKGKSTPASLLVAARQLSICCWIMYVWGRSGGNIEAPFRATELALLHVWDIARPQIGTRTRAFKDLTQVLLQLLALYRTIVSELIDRIAPHVKNRDAIASSVGGSALDVNLALFDLLGRIAVSGLWTGWLAQRLPQLSDESRKVIDKHIDVGLSLIANNSTMALPVTDEQATSVALFLLLWCQGSSEREQVGPWIQAMVRRYCHTIGLRKSYPTCKTAYRELLIHPIDGSDAYFEEATAGSTLIPLLAVWATALGETLAAQKLADLVAKELTHCTLQLWTVDGASDQHLYVNDDNHGRAIFDLKAGDVVGAVAMLEEVRVTFNDFAQLSAIRAGWWPMVLTACRHWRLPVPIDFYSPILATSIAVPASDGQTAAAHDENQNPAAAAAEP